MSRDAFQAQAAAARAAAPEPGRALTPCHQTWRSPESRGSDAGSRFASDPVLTPLTRTSVHAVLLEGMCAVTELTHYSTRQCVPENSEAPACGRDHNVGRRQALCRHNVKAADDRPHDGGEDGAELGDGQHDAGTLASLPEPPPQHLTLQIAGSPTAMFSPAAQQHCVSHDPRRTLDKAAGLRARANCGSAGSGAGGQRERWWSSMVCWPAAAPRACLGHCLA